jgi:tetratricopeptide (TPR) repeat protein
MAFKSRFALRRGAAQMARLHILGFGSVTLAAALALYLPCGASAAESETANGIVLGGGNSLLAEGSVALQEGRIADGIHLTQAGLKDAADPREAAIGHSNLCAGYALLREWAVALQECNTAITLDHSNWQSFNNRAAARAGLGQYDLALADVRAGLALEPQSSTLLKSLAVVEHNQKVINKRSSSVLHS